MTANNLRKRSSLRKGHEDSQRLSGQGAQGVDAAQTQGQGGDQPLHLLP